MRIYTRKGDLGKTQVLGSPRRFKDDIRIQAYGAVDEAGAAVGVAVSILAQDPRYDDIVEVLTQVQQGLWDAGADLARLPHPRYPYRTPDDAGATLERVIDRYDAEVPPLSQFIVRGGAPGGAALHFACTVVRRAERDVVRLQRQEGIHPPVLVYLNRLSDLLFVLARVVNHRAGEAEIPYANSAHVFRQ